MANGTDSEEYIVLSRIRPGLKREFAFAMRSQSKYSGFVGRTRASRTQNVQENSSNKRFKNEESLERENGDWKSPKGENGITHLEEEPKSVVVDQNDSGPVVQNGSFQNNEVKSAWNEYSVVGAKDFEQTTILPSRIIRSSLKDVKTEELDESDVINSLINPSNNNLETKMSKTNNLGEPSTSKDDSQSNQGEAIEPNCEQLVKPVPVDNVLCRRSTRSALRPVVKTEEVTENESTNSIVSSSNNKLEMKISKKIVQKRFPTKLKELLYTGLLEGLPVTYVHGTKVRGLSYKELPGMIKGSGILCYCDKCNGNEVVTPNQFELHAGSANKRPPEYIYLENGKTMRDVLNACKIAPLEGLEAAIRQAIGCLSVEKPTFCLNCKGLIPESGNGKTMLLCDPCMAVRESEPSSTQLNDCSDRSPLSVSAPTSSARVAHSSSTRSKGQGRLTRKDLRMHKLVFEEDVLADGTALAYYARGQKLLEGYKKGSGIFCFCCNSEVSPSQFEAHAGWASRRKPYLHIYTSNGVSLHELSIRLATERKFSADENDDLCSICADGGDLLLCDNCPRAFHPECVSLPMVPQGTWYCKYCQNMFQKEKFVEGNVNAVAAGRVAGVDPIEEITQRCIRIVETPEGIGACVLCRAYDFSRSGFGPRTVIICDQCEKEYHVGCLKEHKMDNLKELPEDKWFCCMDCNRIHSSLQNLVACGEKMLPDSLLSALKKKQAEKCSEDSANLDIRWRLLSGRTASDDSRVLLSKAVSIFHDRFDPIADSTTSRLDLIPHLVYGRNMKEQEFGGMYCAILTVNSTIVSAGIFRIFGQEVAEIPLVATSSDCQGQGYFQSLFSCIESVLASLNVRNLVLPAADEAESIWTKKFGFERIPAEHLKLYRRNHPMMVFQGTSMLYKPVPKS